MSDITGLFDAGSDIPLFETQIPVDFISDLHKFCDDNDDTSMGDKFNENANIYETPWHKELMCQLPGFPDTVASGLPVDADTQPSSPIDFATVNVKGPHGPTQISIPSGSSPTEIRRALVAGFGLETGPFVLRDSTGCVVPISAATQGGQFSLEVPSIDSKSSEPNSNTLKFLQEPPHSAAVWLHTKLTKKGDIAGSCIQHVFSPAPKVGIYIAKSPAGSTPADNREAMLAQATVTLVNAAGEEAVDKNGELVMHTGTPVIRTDPVTNECSITWPEMAVLDTSRTVHNIPAKELKVSAKECGGNRGAVGWFSLKVSVPGCEDLWLRNPATGQIAKIIVKNERNAALGWAEKAEGPYADHSRCVPSHIDQYGNRLCRHGCCGGKQLACGHSRTQVKMEP